MAIETMTTIAKKIAALFLAIAMVFLTISSAVYGAPNDAQEVKVISGNSTLIPFTFVNEKNVASTVLVEVDKRNTDEAIYPYIQGIKATIIPPQTSLQSNKATLNVVVSAPEELPVSEYDVALIRKIDDSQLLFKYKIVVDDNEPSVLQNIYSFYEEHMLAIAILLFIILASGAVYVTKKWGEK